jgi:hypothetical protein
MNLFENLAAHGLTIDVMQVMIISAVFIVLIGMYWQFFAIGIGGMFCLYVLAGTPSTTKPVPLNDWKDTKLQKMEEQRRIDFLKDCQGLGDSYDRCMNIWLDKEE